MYIEMNVLQQLPKIPGRALRAPDDLAGQRQ